MITDDLTRVTGLALATLTAAADRDWGVPAGALTWTCWETLEHLSDDLFVYAAQLAPATPSLTTHVPFGWRRAREGGPLLTVFVEPAEGNLALLTVLESCAALFAAMLTAAPPDRLSFHPYGVSDPSGFAAMGVVETLVHLHDVTSGLGLPWQPPPEVCARTLRRLFPKAPAGTEPWRTLLWATGRADLPGHPAQTGWTWDASPVG